MLRLVVKRIKITAVSLSQKMRLFRETITRSASYQPFLYYVQDIFPDHVQSKRIYYRLFILEEKTCTPGLAQLNSLALVSAVKPAEI